MNETTETIAKWAEREFGEATIISTACRAAMESAELLYAAEVLKDYDKVAEELADVWIVLERLLWMCGRDSAEVVDHLRARKAYLSQWGTESLCCSVGPWTWAIVGEVREHEACGCGDAMHEVEMAARQAMGVMCLIELAFQGLRTSRAAQVDAKMAVNRRREWQRDGSGHGKHVPSA